MNKTVKLKAGMYFRGGFAESCFKITRVTKANVTFRWSPRKCDSNHISTGLVSKFLTRGTWKFVSRLEGMIATGV
jgi:hypothetical protein